MSASQKHILVICGGPSAEHDVSLISSQNVVAALRGNPGFRVSVVAVTRDYRWLDFGEGEYTLDSRDAGKVRLDEAKGKPFDFNALFSAKSAAKSSAKSAAGGAAKPYDAVFPIIHGPFGEDGSLQGLLKCARLPFVGSGVLGSALAMDKVQSKRVLHHLDIPQAAYDVLYRDDPRLDHRSKLWSDIHRKLGTPVFVKPANMGSSVGVARASSEPELADAVNDALRFDHKVIIEQAIGGREVECAVLGNQKLKASPVFGEITAGDGFYSYKAKYLDDSLAALKIPSDVPVSVAEKLSRYALTAFKGLDCLGLARVDFFVDGEQVVLNEINTLPGFTAISMYPKLWEHAGLSAADLAKELIELAEQEFARSSQLELTV